MAHYVDEHIDMNPICEPEDGFDEEGWHEQNALDDPDGPQACDLTHQDDDETATVPCPHCGEDVADFADRCPYCGDWIVPGGQAGVSSRGLIFAAVVVLAILALLYWLMAVL